MTFYDLEFNTPQGKSIKMSNFKIKVVLIVNTATKCGLAPQFDELEAIHQKYKNNDFVVLGFPSNQFLNQEPETNETVEETCRINHGVTFQLSEKIDVNGENTHPVFAYLKNELPGTFGNNIKWNFTKFLIDKNGKPFRRYAPTTKPKKIENDIIEIINQRTNNE